MASTKICPSRRGKERLLNGEFYAGGFMGAAFTPSQNLKYLGGFTLNREALRTSRGSGHAV